MALLEKECKRLKMNQDVKMLENRNPGIYRILQASFRQTPRSASRKRTSDAKPSAAASARKRKPSKTAWRLCACVRMWA